MRLVAKLSLLLAVLTALGVEAQDACLAPLLAPPTIHRTPQPLYEGEVALAGTLMSPGMPATELSTGAYVYLMAEDGRMVYAPKYDWQAFQKGQPWLATHKALLKRLGSAKIVAAGEWTVAFGQIVKLNNRSGNFKGGAAHLAFAENILRRFGFDLDSALGSEDYSDGRERKEHTPQERTFDRYQMELFERLQTQSQMRLLAELYEDFVDLVRPHTPHKSVSEVNGIVFQAALAMQLSAEVELFLFPIGQSLTDDGFVFGLVGQTNKRARMRLLGPMYLEATLKFLRSQLTKEEKAQFQMLKRRFRELER
ncbi:MAG: hypothetical protein AB7F86_03585 [Bdellovibrionales bacterium]